MGCSSSTSASNPNTEGGKWKEDQEFVAENNHKRTKFDKTTGQSVVVTVQKQRPETDFFEPLEAGHGEQFMAVRPYIGAIMEPTNHPPVNASAPDQKYKLDYVYGYRCADSRQNVYFNAAGQAVYMTAALGVILDQASNTQKFFGGGVVENTAKNVANDESCHTDDITSITMSDDRKWAASGQVGSAPSAFVWNSATGEKKQRYKLTKGARGVNAIALSGDNKYVALVDISDDHNVYVYDVETGAVVMKEKGDTNKIMDIAFTQKSGQYDVATAGAKHIKFWNPVTKNNQKGLFGSNGEMTSFSCVAYDTNGVAYTGGCNSQIYIWPTRDLQKTVTVHKGGFICALKCTNNKLYSGGKDGNLCITDIASLTVEKTFNFGCLIRAIDVVGSKGLVGLRDGSITEIDISNGSKTPLMEGHSDGEVWGLSAVGDHVYTTGDDNKLKVWDFAQRQCIKTGVISTESRKAKRGGASSLTELPDSQCARAVAKHPSQPHIAVGHNDGTLTIRTLDKSQDQVVKTINDAKEWIEVIAWSPDGSKLAVGSHDNVIYVYESTSFKLLGKLTAHKSFIVSLDWSDDSTYIRSVCGAHELLFHDVSTFKQDPNGASNNKGTNWATNSAKYGWLVEGIFPSGTDGTHINSVDFSSDNTLIATGDDYGLVNIFRNPCRVGSKPISLRGHSEHVVRVKFHKQDTYIFSVGGYDQTLMQWKRC